MLKYIEIRDSGTFIPAACFKPSRMPIDAGAYGERVRRVVAYGMSRVGYPDDSPVVMIVRLDINECQNDPYEWSRSSRTMRAAHVWIQDNFDKINNGDVVDVQFILGETNAPKTSEATS